MHRSRDAIQQTERNPGAVQALRGEPPARAPPSILASAASDIDILKFTACIHMFSEKHLLPKHTHPPLVVVQIGGAAAEAEVFRFVFRFTRVIQQDAYIAKAGLRTAGSERNADASSTAIRPPNPTEAEITKVKRIEFGHLEAAVERCEEEPLGL